MWFSIFSVCLRWRKETPRFATVALAGFLCAILTASILFVQSDAVLMPNRHIYLSMVHGTLIGVGVIVYSVTAASINAKIFIIQFFFQLAVSLSLDSIG